MAFCRNCGSEVPEGTKFCSNCGASMEIDTQESNQRERKDETFYTSDVYMKNTIPVLDDSTSKMDKFGKFYGIILMILAFVDFQTDPAALTIVLSAAIIAGCIFCFSKKYKLKGFTIVALILAIICLLIGISHAKKIGLFKIPGKDKTAEAIMEEIAVNENKILEKKEAVKETSVDEEVEEKEEQQVNEEESIPQEDETVIEDKEVVSEENETASEETETVNEVDPDLKAFLDSYEAFMDEYIDFMKKYKDDPANAISMLTEYTEIMEKYTDFADKINKYDSDKMSTEDAKYYLEVVNRCNRKMLEAY